ncbi:MAG: DUF5372 family protein [Pseudomonadota bacterium]|nr:DUF5372 family protein [Pseudomonadota bacterium]
MHSNHPGPASLVRQRSCREYSVSNARPDPWQEPSTTAHGVCEGQFVEVTHPFHPLFGHRFELLTVRQTWGEYRVFFYDEQDVLKALPASWTDAGTTDPFVTLSAGRAHFRPADLLALVTMLERLRDSGVAEEGG